MVLRRNVSQAVKENAWGPPLRERWLWAGAALSLAAAALASLPERALPTPVSRAGPPTAFRADDAYDRLLKITSVGPRVAGSYELEVTTVSRVVSMLRELADGASPHQRLEIDVHRGDGAFPIQFFDGMNNVYRGVQSVVARLSARGASPHAPALLLNCHLDTVPDSPGASDDAAGCAVLLETLRALAATAAPLRHAVLFLFNGAEENIMQASHAFVTQHKWAKSVRAFINIEACGAGGREVLFQAGPRDPWLIEVYAGSVPHPFASSLAQELFESGAVPGDTDFRIFRDFGNLSGVDLAWTANGYVYHTALDTAALVPRAALQRTGDNVLALARGILSSEHMETAVRWEASPPVFFDVLGLWVVALQPPVAVAAALALCGAAVLRLQLDAARARRQLHMPPRAWWLLVASTALRLAAAAAAGVAAATALAGALHCARLRTLWYSQPLLLLPLYAAPALSVSWWASARLCAVRSGALAGRWSSAAARGALTAGAAALLAAAVLLRLRAGFVAALWAAGFTLTPHIVSDKKQIVAMWACTLLPQLQTWYLAEGVLRVVVPLAGRSGTAPLDVLLSLLVAGAALSGCCWLLPLLLLTPRPTRICSALVCACLSAAAWCALSPLHAVYSDSAPQRLIVLHTRRTLHAPAELHEPEVEYWLPQLDGNQPYNLYPAVEELRAARPMRCGHLPYCGAPYYLPVRGLVSHAHWLRCEDAPRARLQLNLTTSRADGGRLRLHFNLTGPHHVVVMVAPRDGVVVESCSLQDGAPLVGPEGAMWTLHDAGSGPRDANWVFTVTLQTARRAARAGGQWAAVSAAGHAMSGAAQRSPGHAGFLARLPPAVAATGWGVHLHLLYV